ncbi:hypothetical protein SAMN05892883_1662 [Jatrophihabitans sp. GAS493]|uniref:CPBP family glutamic-type intramembrane protease n=1 Tax=Jatrophihabitans sp. GAS493 TaxID=1907575 RepID=UPI000BB7F074|nr:CPBP family glutamic-type intramembrane protease [Jatrophihabitans sp. GAS493]SOD72253.1 hypothetical protein SAMN05892883_1662 [Jatrophihabitans sp. GAS493]
MVPPGWYTDPVDQRIWRWWDGYAWTPASAPKHLPAGGYVIPAGTRTTPPLDAAVAQMRLSAPQPWGWRPVGVPLIAFVALIVLGSFAGRYQPSTYSGRVVYATTANLLVEGLLALSVWWAARPIAARYGGWGPTFGLRLPRWIDLGYAAVGGFVAFILRMVVGLTANGLTNGEAVSQSQNLTLHHVTPAAALLLFGVLVVAAPLIEEVVFRGLLLRSFMRRMTFWPAALLSTAIFALMHTYEVRTLVGAVTLAAGVGCLGLVNCYLNRLTNRLTPGIIVHAVFNALALAVVIAQAG